MRKKVLAIALAIFLVALAGCGNSDSSAQQGDSGGAAQQGQGGNNADEVVLTYWNFTSTDMPFEADLIASFEAAHPGIRINVERVSVEHFHDQIIMAARTNTLPDIIQGIPEWSSNFINAGVMADITTDIQDVYGTFIEDAINLSSWDGRVYGLPFRFGTSATFINTRIFDEAGIPIPTSWTWDEFRDIAMQVTDSSRNVYGFGIPAARHDLGFSWNYFSFAFQNGASYLDGNRAVFNSPEGAEALDFLIQMMRDGIMPAGTPSFTAADVVDAFGAGTLAMFHNGPWYVATIQTAYPDIEFVTVPLPTRRAGTQSASVAGGTYLSVTATTEHYAQALAFIKYMTSEQTMREWAGRGEFLPPVRALLDDDSFIQGHMIAFAQQAQLPSVGIGATVENTTLLDVIQDYMARALIGNISSQEALDAAAERWNEILAGS